MFGRLSLPLRMMQNKGNRNRPFIRMIGFDGMIFGVAIGSDWIRKYPT
jgi:hypothetical protein